MPTFYNFRENNYTNNFDNVFVPANFFRAGNLWVWGNNPNSRLGINSTIQVSTPVTTFVGGSNWRKTSSGAGHSAAIKTDGTLWMWGTNTSAQHGRNNTTTTSTPVTTFAGGTDWREVSCGGGGFTAAIKTNGTLWMWGTNSFGRLGNNTSLTASTPITTFTGGSNWKQVSCGTNFTLALKSDSSLWAWGNNSVGQLGLGVDFSYSRLTPVTTFAGGTNWADTPTTNPEDLYTISGGGSSSSAAIKTDGTLWIWGNNSLSQLGINATGNRPTPVTTFAGGTDWKQVSCANGHTLAIKTDGTLWGWGINSNGSLGAGSSGVGVSTPITTTNGGNTWRQISASDNHNIAVKTDGTLWLSGNGVQGALGNTLTGVATSFVTTFAGGTDWKHASAFEHLSAAVKTDGTLWVWGNTFNGRLGNGVTLSGRVSTPITTFAGGTNWKQVSAGNNYAAAVKTDGTLWVWGINSEGQLGINGFASRSTPTTTIAGGIDWKQVSCGDRHTSAVKTDGTLWVWGNNSRGQLGNNNTGSSQTPITTFAGGTNWKQVSCGEFHTVALFDDGINKILYTFGSSNNGELGINTDSTITEIPRLLSSGWSQVSAGYFHSAAIKTDGTLWTWGGFSTGLGINLLSFSNRYTPVTTFAGGTNWKQVSCGTDFSGAIKTDGTLWLWGDNNYGALGNNDTGSRLTPSTTFAGGNNWKQVSCTNTLTVISQSTGAIKTDGTLWIWGYNGRRELGNNDTQAFIDTPITTFLGGSNWKEISVGEMQAAIAYDDPYL